MTRSPNAAPSARELGERAQTAAAHLATTPGDSRNAGLQALGSELIRARDAVMEANAEDVAEAQSQGLPEPLVQRLTVDDGVFRTMQDRIAKVAKLPDPLGRTLQGMTRPNGLQVSKVSVPLGVIGMIFESRPNVATDAAAVCLKSGNAVILRGGSEARRTNLVLAETMEIAIRTSGLPTGTIQMLRAPGHEPVRELLQLTDLVDVIIPRGGKPLIEMIARESRIPVIKHYEGICHLYLAADAPAEQAVALSVNSKCQRVEVCNALETLLVDGEAAQRLLPTLAGAFAREGVELRGCEATRSILPGCPAACAADWTSEYLAPILSVRVVQGLDQAVQHINTYGSGHTDGIVTTCLDRARQFVARVDSASVLVNASTRLSGGGDYGLGAVVGISTDKLHARGPVGPSDLTSYKWVVFGDGHLRA